MGGSFRDCGQRLYSASKHKTEKINMRDAYVGSNGAKYSSIHKPIMQICLKCVYIPVATTTIQW